MSDLEIRPFSGPGDGALWNAFVSAAPDAGPSHRWEWRDVLADAFGFAPRYCGALREGRVVGVLPAVRMRDVALRPHWVSLPFLTSAGPCAVDDATAEALLEAALAREPADVRAQIRLAGERRADGWRVRTDVAAAQLALDADPDAVWRERLGARVRNQVRKAQRAGVSTQRGGSELLAPFYGVWSRRMHELGTPPFPRRFFAEILRRFEGDAWLRVAWHDGRAVGGMILVRSGPIVADPWAATLREAHRVCANNLLYWDAIREACGLGARAFDLGRSPRGSGALRYKLRWGAREVPLTYLVGRLRPGADATAASPADAFGAAVAVWRRLPGAVVGLVGPRLVRFLPDL